MSLFEEGLRLAEQGGQWIEEGPSNSSTPCSSTLEQLVDLVAKKGELCRLRACMHAQQDHLSSRHLVDGAVLQGTAGALDGAAELLQRIVAERAVLAVRLKDQTSKQTVGIEPQLQRQFTALLREAAGAATLETRQHDLHWAAQCSEPPSTWERRLHALTLAVEACHEYHTQLVARSSCVSEFAAEHQACTM